MEYGKYFVEGEAWTLTCHNVIYANECGIYTVLSTKI
jgi:hypothetical protein